MKSINEIKLFIVEDNFAFSFVLESILKEYGDIKIVTIPSGEKCIEQLDANPDAIILDYNLEGNMNGFETFKVIHSKKPSIPVIVLSEQLDTQVVSDLLKAGVYDYISKGGNEYLPRLKESIIKALRK